tara:strand:+ start:82 stop:576 length:495 start_codon:yes stop_codon:yes gene_type:complete
MKGFPMHGGTHKGDEVDFGYAQSAVEKAKQDLDMMKLGSRFDESGKRKKGEAKKIAKMTRKWTGLDQQKYDREAKRESSKFERKYGEGQEGLDKFRDKQQKKRKRKKTIGKIKKAVEKINPFDAQSKTKRKARRGARKTSERVSGNRSGAGSGCEKTGSCGAFD